MRALLALLCLALPASAQEYSPWLLLGPFDHEGGAAAAGEQHPLERELPDMRPGGKGIDLSRTYRGEGGATVAWRPLPGDRADATAVDVGVIDFLQALQPPAGVEGWRERSAVFLYRRITCAEPTELLVQMGSDDGMQLWLDGERLIDKQVSRGLNLGDEQLELPLAAGEHHLLIKVVQEGGAWSFRMAPWARCSQEAIDAAIDRGVDFLLDQQLIDGSWAGYEEYGNGHTAYCVYTLLKCNLPADHPAVRRGVEAMRTRPTGYTYSLSCELLALCALGPSADSTWRERVLRDLVEIQESSGLYAYPVHPGGFTDHDDLSNTLYAALALRAAADAGMKVPERTWRRLIEGTFRCYDSDGDRAWKYDRERAVAGFGYRPDSGSTGSMTTAGLSVLEICDEQLEGKHSKAVAARLEAARSTGLRWLESNMTWATNPPGQGHHYFFIYGMERVGVLLGLTVLGGVDWYWSGADYLVRNQKENGAWAEDRNAVDTILALLFLKRATMVSTGRNTQARSRSYVTAEEGDLRLRTSGDTPMAVWIERVHPDRVKELEWPGQPGLGPRVARVEFLARRAEDGAEWAVIGVDEGDAAKPAGSRRFATQHRFARNGEYLLKARMTAMAPPGEDGGGGARVLESPELRVRVDAVLAPELLEYASDRGRDLLADSIGRVQASTSAGGHEPEKAADGRMGSSWRSAGDDAQPWIELELRRAVRGDRILLTHPEPWLARRDGPRPATVEVLVNDKDRHVVTMDPDVTRKTVLVLEKPERIRKLRLTILESRDRGASPVGFAEVELQDGD